MPMRQTAGGPGLRTYVRVCVNVDSWGNAATSSYLLTPVPLSPFTHAIGWRRACRCRLRNTTNRLSTFAVVQARMRQHKTCTLDVPIGSIRLFVRAGPVSLDGQ
jgi:hypothetical protein